MAPIPEFCDGCYLPEGVHECTIEEIEAKLLFSDQRKHTWKLLKNLLYRLNTLGFYPEILIINGSFVTSENNPGDVDLAILLSAEKVVKALNNITDEFDKRAIWLFASNPSEVRSLFGTHLFIVDTEESLSKFIHFFQDKKNSFHGISRRKGILKVIPLYTAKEGDECGK